jgi:hypothetical protein
MFELQSSATPAKRSLLSWLGAACVFSALYFVVRTPGYSPMSMLLVIGGNILITVDARQKKEAQLTHLLPQ